MQGISDLKDRGIKYIGSEGKRNEKYLPFEYGNIHEEDLQYIIDNKIGFEEISKYTDGWYSCLPFVGMYEIYGRQVIQDNYIKILHNSLFARSSNKDYLGNWNLLLGNILDFLLNYEIDVDWNKLYTIFSEFLNITLLRL